jgi:N-acetyl-alpha-D-muramate 1-phosphate uridylyltransferase
VIAMILAAGRGERLRPLTDEMPKALVEVNGESLLERHLNALAEAGVTTVVINLGWLGEQIVERVGSGSKFGLQIIYSPEYDNVLETGGGIHHALPLLGKDPFWVVNADTYTDFRLYDLALDDNALGHLILVPTPEHKDGGDFDLVDGMVSNNGNRPHTYGGIAVYRPELFAGQVAGRFSLVPLIREAADAGRLSGSIYEGLWEDIGTAERLTKLNEN